MTHSSRRIVGSKTFLIILKFDWNSFRNEWNFCRNLLKPPYAAFIACGYKTECKLLCSSQHVWSWVLIGLRLETCNRFGRGQLATLSVMSRQVGASEGNIMPHQSWSNVQLNLAERVRCSKTAVLRSWEHCPWRVRCWAWSCVQPTQNTFTPPHFIAANMHTGVEHNKFNVQIAFFTQRSVRCSWLRDSQN